jgi:hypothetical protein
MDRGYLFLPKVNRSEGVQHCLTFQTGLSLYLSVPKCLIVSSILGMVCPIEFVRIEDHPMPPPPWALVVLRTPYLKDCTGAVRRTVRSDSRERFDSRLAFASSPSGGLKLLNDTMCIRISILLRGGCTRGVLRLNTDIREHY